MCGISLVVWWWRLCASNTGVESSVLDGGTKIPYAKWHSQEKESVWNMGLFLVTGASSSTQKLWQEKIPHKFPELLGDGTTPVVNKIWTLCKQRFFSQFIFIASRSPQCLTLNVCLLSQRSYDEICWGVCIMYQQFPWIFQQNVAYCQRFHMLMSALISFKIQI